MLTLGFDTSNYTTSVAAFDGVGGRNCSRLLDVKPGELGLRQSDALFAHVKRLPELVQALCASVELKDITAIGVSTRPRAVEGSYMPCFLAGWSQASCLAQILGLPFPAGKSIDALSRGSDCRDRYRVKLHGLEFSFSGIQNKAEAFYAATNSPADTARFVMNCIVTCIADATRAALAEKPGLPVVFSGGVASNSMLRERMREFSPVFAEPQYSTDNAMGIAVLTALQEGL